MKLFVGLTLVCSLIFLLFFRPEPRFFKSAQHAGLLADAQPAWSFARGLNQSNPKNADGISTRPQTSATADGPGPGPVSPVRLALQRHPELQEYHAISVKSVLTQRERDQLGNLLSSSRHMGEVHSTLIGEDLVELNEGDETARMMSVDYLISAVAWNENPARAEAIQTMLSIIKADNTEASLPLDLRKSRAGDKVELFTKLLRLAPGVATALEQDMDSRSPLSNLLAFARQSAANSQLGSDSEIAANSEPVGNDETVSDGVQIHQVQH